MTKLVFLILGELSAGELTIADSFQAGLPKTRYESYFIVPEHQKGYVKSRNIPYLSLGLNDGKVINRKKVDLLIKEIKPDFLIFCDVFTVEYSEKWSGINLEIIKGYNIPIISLDEYEYLKAGYSIDYYGSVTKKLKPLLEECDYIIKNCPLTMPAEQREGYFRLFNHIKPLDDERKSAVKDNIVEKKGDKLIFITTSYWETLNIYKIPALSMFIKWNHRIIFNYLKMLDQNITIIHVGHGKWSDLDSDKINYKYFDTLDPVDFERYLLAADLYITNNIVSITLTKAILGKVPSIVFQNDKIIDFSKFKKRLSEMPMWYQEMAEDLKIAYPFKASVFGWSNFLKTALKENPYVDTFVISSLFKLSESIDNLNRLLNDDKSIEELKNNQEKFIEIYNSVPSSFNVIEEIVNKEVGDLK